MMPAEMPSPDKACERGEVATRVRDAIKALPWRERKVIGLYYYGDVTMKKIGNEIGVNESRVSQLHARAVQRLRKILGPDLQPGEVASVMRAAGRPTTSRPMLKMAKARLSRGVRPGRGRKAERTPAPANGTPMPVAIAH